MTNNHYGHNDNISPKMIRALVFSGGGIRGLAFVGCLRALEELDILNQVECYIGTSIGSIVSLLVCIDYKYNELKDILISIDFDQLRDITSDGIFNYFNNYGFETGNKIERVVRIFIKHKVDNENITFKELYEKTGKELVITGTCLNTRKCDYFSYRLTPDLEVIKAIRISMCIPFVFTAQYLNNNLYVDGGVTENYPINAYQNKEEILGFLLRDKSVNFKVNGLDEYALAIIQSIDNKLHELYQNIYNNITITIPTNIGVMEFSVGEDEKISMFNLGYNLTKEYLDSNKNRIEVKDIIETNITHSNKDKRSENSSCVYDCSSDDDFQIENNNDNENENEKIKDIITTMNNDIINLDLCIDNIT